jgi:tetratricopeptide (TPR) repeat protein
MQKSCLVFPKIAIILLFTLSFIVFAFAKDIDTDLSGFKRNIKKKESTSLSSNEILTQLQELSRLYRQEGLQKQRAGDLGGALNSYQKAVVADPFYSVAYNDLGIIYETQGNLELAEENYLKAIQVDPYYLSPYSNLALLYESKRDLKNAALYWQKRIELGLPDDPWTERANRHLENIQIISGERKIAQINEREVVNLVEDITGQKELFREDNTAQANAYFAKAKVYYKKGELATALKEAINARQLEPSNIGEIDEFIDKVQKRLLTK